MVKVENMTSENTGRGVPNQFIITTPDGRYFQSYQTVIAFDPRDLEKAFYALHPGKSLKDCGLTTYPRFYLDERSWDCSTTTGKYRNRFLMDSSIKEARKHIKDGRYALVDLNK